MVDMRSFEERVKEIATKAVMDTLFLMTIRDRVKLVIGLVSVPDFAHSLELARLMAQMRGFREALVLTDQTEKVEQLDYLWEVAETHPVAVARFGRGALKL